MRVLFHVEPLAMHNRPFHYWAWLARTADMAHALAAAGEDVECRWLLNAALATRAVAPRDRESRGTPAAGHGLPREAIAVLGQEELREAYGVPNVEILSQLHHGRAPGAALAAHARLLRERLAGFTPEVIVTYTPSAALRAAWPEALILHTENGLFSRAPYAPAQFFDPEGLYAHSLLATRATELAARTPTAGETALLASLRARASALAQAASPFHALESAMRERYARLALLPLQFGGEAGFDLNGPFRNQGEYLLHVLERLPADVGVLVTEHPTALWVGDRIDEETRTWLADACPQAEFVPLEAAPFAGQALIPHVDAVISVSSSLGLQARFWGRDLVAPGASHLAPWVTHERIEDLSQRRDATPPDGMLGWALTHYFVPESLCLADGAWIAARWRAQLAAWRSGVRGLALLSPAAADADLHARLVEAMPEPPLPVDPSWLANGDFTRWLSGGTLSRPGGWEVLPAGATLARLPGDEGGVRVTPAGEGETLLLQRIPDARRFAGRRVEFELRARAPHGGRVELYLYSQPGEGGASPSGTPAAAFAPGPEWTWFTAECALPARTSHELRAGHHTEVVLRLPAGSGPVEIGELRIARGELNAA